MDSLEAKLNDLFTKTISVKLPENARQGLVKIMPWLALIGGAITAFGVWGIVSLYMMASQYLAYGYAHEVASLSAFIWVSVALLVVEAILLFMAFKPLEKRQKRGWNLLFWMSLLNLVYAVVSFVANPRDAGGLLWSVLSSGVGLYLLFQVRSYYTGATTPNQLPPTPSANK